MANIRTARRSGLVLRGGRNRRDTLWGSTPAAITTLAAASTATLVASLSAAALALRPFTIVRIRGYWFVDSDQSAASEDYGAAIGCCVVSDQSVAIGVTAVPTPETDRGSDLWMLHETMYGSFQFGTAVGFETLSGNAVDSKAMRKVEEGQDFILVVETPATVSSARIQTADRFLVKLH